MVEALYQLPASGHRSLYVRPSDIRSVQIEHGMATGTCCYVTVDGLPGAIQCGDGSWQEAERIRDVLVAMVNGLAVQPEEQRSE